MGFELGRLSALKVQRLRKEGYYADGGGLYLQIKGGSRSWVYRYKGRYLGLGSIHAVSLAKARLKAREAREARAEGIDPIDAKRAQAAAARAAASSLVTFEEAAKRYIAAHEGSWKNPKHAQQWPNSLKAYAYPVIGKLSVAAIDTGLVLKCVEPIWQDKPETAARVRMRIETVLAWSTARGYRSGDNPARWRSHLDQLLPPRRKVRRIQHHPALPYSQMGNFMQELRLQEGVAARALEFVILTSCRTGEAIEAKWNEFDLKRGLWIIPAQRMKAGREHRVALSKRAIEILCNLPVEGEFVFVGSSKGRPLSNMAMLKLLRRMERDDITVHGFRSTFRDWASECTNFSRELCEMALAHQVGDKVEAAYRRGDMLEKRRRLAEAWATYCSKAAPQNADNVVAIQTSAHHG